MQLLDRAPNRFGHSVTPEDNLSRQRRTGPSRYARFLAMMLFLLAWGSNSSTAEQRSVGPDPASATTPTPEEITPTAPGHTTSGKYDLALGKSVFNHTCLTCHGNSVLDAPRVGDMHVWQPRLAQGLDILIQHTLNGHGRMPAKGGDGSLTDYEVSSAVAYVYQVGTEILAKQDKAASHPACDPVSNLDQCTPEEMKRLLVLQMLWLLGGPRQ
jgi:cytochrome c5